MTDLTIPVDARTYGKLLAVLRVPGAKWGIADVLEAAVALKEQLRAEQSESACLRRRLLQLQFECDEREDEREDQQEAEIARLRRELADTLITPRWTMQLDERE